MSAVASVSTPGVLPTQMPRSVHGGTSMLLKPTAKLLTTLSRGAGVEQSGVDPVGQQRHQAVTVGDLLAEHVAGGGNCSDHTSASQASLMSPRPTSGRMRVTKTFGFAAIIRSHALLGQS